MNRCGLLLRRGRRFSFYFLIALLLVGSVMCETEMLLLILYFDRCKRSLFVVLI